MFVIAPLKVRFVDVALDWLICVGASVAQICSLEVPGLVRLCVVTFDAELSPPNGGRGWGGYWWSVVGRHFVNKTLERSVGFTRVANQAHACVHPHFSFFRCRCLWHRWKTHRVSNGSRGWWLTFVECNRFHEEREVIILHRRDLVTEVTGVVIGVFQCCYEFVVLVFEGDFISNAVVFVLLTTGMLDRTATMMAWTKSLSLNAMVSLSHRASSGSLLGLVSMH